MNERYEALFASNRDIFDGARVLDLASHDGRYSFAALKTGAAHVTGVEVRQSLIDRAQETFAFYGQDPETYRFVCGDVFEVLAREEFDVDVVLCLGYLYHTYRHTELMYRLHHLAPRHLIVDTMVTLDTQPTLKVMRERDVEDIRSAAQDAWSVDRVLVLRPSVPALQMLVRSYGFEIESCTTGRASWPADRPCRCRRLREGHARDHAVPLPRGGGRSRMGAGSSSADRRGPRPHGRARSPQPPAQPADGWRGQVNKTLARATGYELRRASTKS